MKDTVWGTWDIFLISQTSKPSRTTAFVQMSTVEFWAHFPLTTVSQQQCRECQPHFHWIGFMEKEWENKNWGLLIMMQVCVCVCVCWLCAVWQHVWEALLQLWVGFHLSSPQTVAMLLLCLLNWCHCGQNSQSAVLGEQYRNLPLESNGPFDLNRIFL